MSVSTSALLGADGYFALVNQTVQLGEHYGVHPYRMTHLLDRYGSLVDEVLAMAAGKPELLQPITDAPAYLQVEAVYAAAAEGALHLDDVLARRTRISIEAWDRGVSAAPVAAALMAKVLGWDAKHEQLEVDTYLERVRAERESQTMPDDESADRVRLEAPEIVQAV